MSVFFSQSHGALAEFDSPDGEKFICEWQFPTGRDSITSCRDVNNQAVFVLKGKPLTHRTLHGLSAYFV